MSLIAAAMLTTTMPQWVEYALLTAAVLMVPPPAFGLLGSFFAAFVPGRARARVWIAISLVLEVAGVVAGTVPGVAAADPQLVPEPLFVPAAALLSVVLGFLAWVFLLVYLDRLADYLERPGAAADALGMIVRGLLYAAAPIAIGAAAFGLGLLLPDFAYIFGFAAVVAIVVWLFKAVRFVFEYLEVLKVLREAIAEKIAKPKRR